MLKAYRASIIISYYEGDFFLHNFLRNVVEQSIFLDCEFLIDLNLPSKMALNLVEKFTSNYPNNIRAFETTELRTIYQSWNFCVKHASSDILIIWNIDDIRTKNSLELQCNYLDQNPDIDFVYSNFKIAINGDMSNAKLVDKSKIIHKDLLTGMHLGPFYGYRKKIHDSIGFYDEQFKAGGDFDFAVRMASKYRGGCIKDSLGWYYDAGMGLSTGRSMTPIYEKNIIYFRHGIWGKIEYNYLLHAVKIYDANAMYFNGYPIKLNTIIPQKKFTFMDLIRGIRCTLIALFKNFIKKLFFIRK